MLACMSAKTTRTATGTAKMAAAAKAEALALAKAEAAALAEAIASAEAEAVAIATTEAAELAEAEAAAEAIAEESEVKNSESEAITPLVELFQEKGIRIMGTVNKPIFCAGDVAVHIGDSHYMRRIEKYTVGLYTQWGMACDTLGRSRKTMFFTEVGLYKYLLQVQCAAAEPFQLFVYNLLREERERTVDAVQLALKIEQTRCEELRREKAALTKEKTALHAEKMFLKREQNDAYRMLNDMREGSKRLQKEKANLVKEKHAAEDAAFAKRWGPSDTGY
jgi:prophage antirepressor-like protein